MKGVHKDLNMQICPHCHTGKLELQKVVFVQQHGPGTIIVDHIPALICDACGDKSYDTRALETLQRLLWSPVAAKARPQAPPVSNT